MPKRFWWSWVVFQRFYVLILDFDAVSTFSREVSQKLNKKDLP